jgi:hypothetical protein
MLPSQTTSALPDAESRLGLPEAVKNIIVHFMTRQYSAAHIAAHVEANFHIKVDRPQMLACWYERHPLKTQTEPTQAEPTRTGPGQNQESEPRPTEAAPSATFQRIARDTPQREGAFRAPVIRDVTDDYTSSTRTGPGQDKGSVQLPADEAGERLFTRMFDGEMPDGEMSGGETPDASGTDPMPQESAPATQTGRRQNEDSLQIPTDTVDQRTPHDRSIQALADLARARLGIAPESAHDSKRATQTGRRQNQKMVLTDEVKAFIVRGLARYETPTQVAASVKANFEIDITRRQVFAYDPAGSRPPAQRWIDLHAATRAKFMEATAEIGVAQKVVRLRMLNRYANRADENNQMERAAKFLVQAALECGGFYERFQRSKAVVAPTP